MGLSAHGGLFRVPPGEVMAAEASAQRPSRPRGRRAEGDPKLTQKRGSPRCTILLQGAQHLSTHTSHRVRDQEPAASHGLSQWASPHPPSSTGSALPIALRATPQSESGLGPSVSCGPSESLPALHLPAFRCQRETPAAPTSAACCEEEKDCVLSPCDAIAGPGSHT